METQAARVVTRTACASPFLFRPSPGSEQVTSRIRQFNRWGFRLQIAPRVVCSALQICSAVRCKHAKTREF